MSRLAISFGIVAVLMTSAAGQVFKPRGGTKSTPTTTADKDGTIKSKTKSGFKRKAKPKPTPEAEDETVDEELDSERAPARKPAKAKTAVVVEDDDVDEDETPRGKKSTAANTKPKRWDPNFVLITDDDE